MKVLAAIIMLSVMSVNAGQPPIRTLVEILEIDTGTYKVGFHRDIRGWYLVSRTYEGATLRFLEKRPSMSGMDTGFHSAIEIPGGFSYYGETGRILSVDVRGTKKSDSILFADRIIRLATLDSVNKLGLVAHGDRLYLARTVAGKWYSEPQQILIQRPTGNPLYLWQNLTLIALFAAAGVTAWTYWRLVLSRRRITRMRQDIRDQQNPFFTKADVPIGINDQDLLGFGTIEDAIVHVLKNPATALPLSIVISGAWGSGKSSMMNRIRQKLEEKNNAGRFRTTWFNAWHFQGEKSLLDTFLLSIVKFYERSSFGLFSPFRIRLFMNKLLRFSFLRQLMFWFAVSLIGLTCILILYNFFGKPGSDNFIVDCQNRVSNLARGNLPWTGLSVYTKVVLGALSLLSVVLLRKEFSPTGFLELLNMHQFKIDAEKQAVGHKEKFKREFWEIIAASDRQERVVVFIDDIDRIPGDKILELLEGINFISDIASAPQIEGVDAKQLRSNMVFVLGMATNEVAKNLGTQLKKVSATDADEEKTGLNYIEKMVQLVVSVPYDENRNKAESFYQR